MPTGGTEAWKVPGSDSTMLRLQTPAHLWPLLAKVAHTQFWWGRGGRGEGMSQTLFQIGKKTQSVKSLTLFYNSHSTPHLTFNLHI